ncbi:hypothetical protein BGZ65_000579, partial [Modicella reniformis]
RTHEDREKLRSVAAQRARAFLDTIEERKLRALKNKGLLPADTPSNSNISAIENFVILNKACNYRRKLVLLSSFENAFVCLSELKSLLQEYAKPDCPNVEESLSQPDVMDWLSSRQPGCLITKLLYRHWRL